MAERAPLEVHVVTHTHWDREWYLPAGRFRQRLVGLIDELLAAPPPEGESFLLDGQAVVLEDYLAVRPDRAAELSALLRAGRLEAGPWYVLADELIPSGESLVRNLLAGRRALRALRAEPPPVLYSPDAFGHPAALPIVARGFGLELIVLWRGLGGRRWPSGDTFRWRAPDGTEALLYHLPRAGYEFGSNLPTGDDAAAKRWRAMAEELEPRARLGLVLVQNGADHHARQEGHEAALAALERAARPHRVVRGGLRRFAESVSARAGRAELPVVTGELRDSYGYTWTLQGTFATRAAQKRRAAQVERLLVRDAEPWAALVRRRAPERRWMLHAAWKTLLLCHPHDTLCGCSVDEVARAMDARLEDARAQAEGVRDDALFDAIGHDASAARTARERWRPVVLVRNRTARRRSGVAELDIASFIADVPVGPGSAPVGRPPRGKHAPSLAGAPLQVLGRVERHDRIESPRHYPDNDLVEAISALAWVPEVAGFGVIALEMGSSAGREGAPPSRVTAAGHTLDNGVLRASVASDGRVELTAHALGRVVHSLLAFEDVADRGDLYTHSPVGAASRSARFLGARLRHRGPLRATLETRWRVHAATGPGRGTPVCVRLSLDAGAQWLRLDVAGENRTRDHRLRLVLATDVVPAEVHADAAFGPARRQLARVSPEDLTMEMPPATAPLHRYVSLYSTDRGATVYSDGLAEYEAVGGGEVAVTLVRAVGQLSRNDLPERPGHAGWPAPTPDAQSLGPFVASVAMLLHRPRTAETLGLVERTADDVLLPLTGATLRSALFVPAPTCGVELSGDGLALSAVKESDDGGALVLRCTNVTDEPAEGAWTLGEPITEALLARLDETPLEPLAAGDRQVRFVAPPRAVVTILVR